MYRLLIADDEYEIRTGLSKNVDWKGLGFHVEGSFDSGDEVLSFIDNHSVDVILADIVMPGINGIELARRIYERSMNISIVFISGYKVFDYAKEALTYGVKDYLLKPTTLDDIIKVFSRLRTELDRASEHQPQSENPAFTDQLLEAIHRYTHENVKTASLRGASKHINMNMQYLSKIYKQKSGINYSCYLLHVKMESAMKLLRDMNSRICEVSELVGYANPKNFTRAFRMYTGMNPSEYQKRMGAK